MIAATRRFCLAQIGARRHYAIPAILESAGLLDRFYTDLTADDWLVRIASFIPGRVRPGGIDRLMARHVRDVPRAKVHSFPRFGFSRSFVARGTKSQAALYAQYLNANRKFNSLVLSAGFDSCNSMYVFNGAGLELLREAKKRGYFTVLEQTSASLAYEEALLADERENWPGWEDSQTSPEDWRDMSEREAEERSLADRVICGSQYVRDSIGACGETNDNCRVVPYGYRELMQRAPESEQRRALNVLLPGTICLRKGFQYAMLAASKLPSDEFHFRLVGPQGVSDQAMADLARHIELRGAVPRSTMCDHYAWADVLLLPTVSEGSANVCYEALAAGVPVITTPNAGSVVRDGSDGLIVPIRDVQAICDALRTCHGDREALATMSDNAADRATEFTWDRYADRLITAISD